jgi:hypothetical protein
MMNVRKILDTTNTPNGRSIHRWMGHHQNALAAAARIAIPTMSIQSESEQKSPVKFWPDGLMIR